MTPVTRNGEIHGVSTCNVNKNTTEAAMQFSAITPPLRLLLQHSKTLLTHKQSDSTHMQVVQWRQANKQSDEHAYRQHSEYWHTSNQIWHAPMVQ